MELNMYCDGVGAELTGWKAKIGQVVNELDHISTGDKSRVVAQVNELHMIMEELDDRIHRLNTRCPTEYEPDKIELEGKFSGMIPNSRDLWQSVSPADFGG